jgi:hypothetical protein
LTGIQQDHIFRFVADSSIANLPIITLTTDFGLVDWYVATLKSVLLSHAPARQPEAFRLGSATQSQSLPNNDAAQNNPHRS